MHKLSKAEVMREVKDYIYITLGLISYSLGWAAFLLPYQITTGGTTGIGAIIYYATGFPIQWSYFIINAVLMTFAIRVLGPRFSIKTTYAIFTLTFLLWLFQLVVNNYVEAPDMTPDGKPLLLGTGQDFMACIIGAAMCGVGLGITFNYNGSTGGTDIIAAIVNKYKDVSLGRMIMICDVFIISSCYFIFHDWRRVIFGFVTLFIIGVVLDWIINSARQSVQFFIFSKKYDEIADRIIKDADRGVTVLDGTGWYSKNNVKVLVVLAKKRQSLDIFRLVKRIDISCQTDIPETAETLEGNALLKSSYIYKNYHLDCFADDTGLEVEALNGAPGVYSARYAGGEGHDAQANMLKLLHELDGKENRKAQFRTAISLILDGKEYLFEGVIKGEIIKEKRGDSGFGYDPIFKPEGYDRTFAELGNDIKNQISHRALAVQKLCEFLQS